MTAISLIMPTVDWGPTFALCLQAARAGLGADDELLVVFDGLPEDPPGWLVNSGASLLRTGQRQGPAAARNLAAAQARGELLVCVDADVQMHADALSLIRWRFAADPGLTAVFGSYDDQPAAAGLVSRFRNLLHHHTHSSNPGPATTFWAGLGAVRREAFLAAGGFNAAAYARPSIEDIELGLRLSDAGCRILLDPSIQGTHHKRWTLESMLITDVRQRAIPWSRLLLERRELPATLNLTPSARLSAIASLLMLASAPVALLWPGLRLGAVVVFFGGLTLLLTLNHSFHRLLLRRTGWLAASIGVLLHALYLAYASVTFILVRLFEPFIRRRPLAALRNGAVQRSA
jgi:glycosyltransferase involved in cell wall biosynthesis